MPDMRREFRQSDEISNSKLLCDEINLLTKVMDKILNPETGPISARPL